MKFLLAIEVSDNDLAMANVCTANCEDCLKGFIESLRARLTEFYCGPDDHPVRADVIALTDAVEPLITSATVGLDGAEDFGGYPTEQLDAAWNFTRDVSENHGADVR